MSGMLSYRGEEILQLLSPL